MSKPQTKQKRIPTPRQKKAAKEIVKNLLADEPLSTGQVLENVGYGTIVQDPQRILNSDGFQQALNDTGLKQALVNQGINPKRIAEKINVLLNAKDRDANNDYTAIDKGLKHATAIYGVIDSDKPKGNSQNTYNFIFSADVQQQVKQMDETIKQMLTKNHAKEN